MPDKSSQIGPGHPHPPLDESPGSYAAGTAPSKKSEAQLARERVNSDSGKVGVDPSAKHVHADGIENAAPPGPPAENKAMTGNFAGPGLSEQSQQGSSPGRAAPAGGSTGPEPGGSLPKGSLASGKGTSTTGTGSRK